MDNANFPTLRDLLLPGDDQATQIWVKAQRASSTTTDTSVKTSCFHPVEFREERVPSYIVLDEELPSKMRDALDMILNECKYSDIVSEAEYETGFGL